MIAPMLASLALAAGAPAGGAATAGTATAPAVGASRAADQELRKEVVVAAPVEAVWAAWTTSEGAQTFFAPKANIRLDVGGPYEILFAPGAPKGQRGAEGLRVLAWIPRQLVAFEWNAPPAFPEIRNGKRHTFVVVEVAPEADRRTRVTLHHLGWGEGGRWPEVRAYFDQAWDHVLANLVQRFESGPIDWAATQKAKPKG